MAMKRGSKMRKLVLTAILTAAMFLFGLVGQAHAFIFVDLVAKVQRITMIS